MNWKMLTLLSLLTPAFAKAQDSTLNHVLFTNVSVWDGTSDTATPGMNVLVENNLIKQVSVDPIPVNRSATTSVIDGGGKTLMPGLIDMHTHLMFRFGVPVTRDMSASEQGASAYETMQLYMRMGYTTLRDVGGNSLGLSRSLVAGRIKGPRLYSSGGRSAAFQGTTILACKRKIPTTTSSANEGTPML